MASTDEDRRLLHSLTLRNLLSFGPDTPTLELRGLNVLIGPNGSGKSNLVEAVALLRAAANDMRAVIRRGGGVTEWIWKGVPDGVASVDAVISYPQGLGPLRHFLSFRADGQAFRLHDECIQDGTPEVEGLGPYWFYKYRQGFPMVHVGGDERPLSGKHLQPDQSVIAQLRDPQAYYEMWHLAETYARIRVYREWSFGRSAVFREPQKADMRNDRLEEDFSNLGLFLNRLRRNPKAKAAVLEHLRNLYEGIDDYDVSIEGGTVQAFFIEGSFIIPATRLSDGTLRYLCLLAILLDPDPPALVCIEEPELGLHPDILPRLSDLLVDASERTQLIVTTHSDILVDALTDMPEAVVVCEKHNGQTEMRRLDAAQLSGWLERYRLGELWTRGELGGTRW